MCKPPNRLVTHLHRMTPPPALPLGLLKTEYEDLPISCVVPAFTTSMYTCIFWQRRLHDPRRRCTLLYMPLPATSASILLTVTGYHTANRHCRPSSKECALRGDGRQSKCAVSYISSDLPSWNTAATFSFTSNAAEMGSQALSFESASMCFASP